MWRRAVVLVEVVALRAHAKEETERLASSNLPPGPKSSLLLLGKTDAENDRRIDLLLF